MVKTLYLIRHGETEGDGTRRYKGRIDVPLSERGREQAREVGAFLRQVLLAEGETLRAVYSSDLSRAAQSADLACGPMGLVPTAIEGLRERDFGAWEGMSFDEIAAQYPGEFSAWAKDPLNFSPIGGESTLQVRDRVLVSVEGIFKKHKDGDSIAIIAHGGVNRVILCCYMGIPLQNIFRIEQDFACLNIINFYDGLPVAKLINGNARGHVAGQSVKG